MTVQVGVQAGGNGACANDDASYRGDAYEVEEVELANVGLLQAHKQFLRALGHTRTTPGCTQHAAAPCALNEYGRHTNSTSESNMLKLEQIPKSISTLRAFYLNMPDDVERRANMEYQLKHAGRLSFTRIEATVLNDLTDLQRFVGFVLTDGVPIVETAASACGSRDQRHKHGFALLQDWVSCVNNHSVDPQLREDPVVHWNQAGCFQRENPPPLYPESLHYISHLVGVLSLLERRDVQNGDGVTLFFEDDVALPSGFVEKVQAVIANAPADWDVLKLGWWDLPGSHLECMSSSSNYNLIRPATWSYCDWGMHALAIRDASARRVFDSLRSKGWGNADRGLQTSEVRMYALGEPLVRLANLANQSTYGSGTPCAHIVANPPIL